MNDILSPLRRAVKDYDMIKDGDRVCVGVSGGKDSVLLLVALSRLSKFYPKKFEVFGYTVDAGKEPTDFSSVSELCKRENIEYHIEKTDIFEIVFDRKKEENPCSLCSTMRRGALCNGARKLGATVLALGHHNDDVLETFMLNLINGGRIRCFQPVTDYDGGALRVIRPFIYVSEQKIRSCVKRNGLPVVKSICPVDGHTQRQEMRNLISSIEKEHKGAKKRIFGALCRSGLDGWKEF